MVGIAGAMMCFKGLENGGVARHLAVMHSEA
jgi:hypothetical protein